MELSCYYRALTIDRNAIAANVRARTVKDRSLSRYYFCRTANKLVDALWHEIRTHKSARILRAQGSTSRSHRSKAPPDEGTDASFFRHRWNFLTSRARVRLRATPRQKRARYEHRSVRGNNVSFRVYRSRISATVRNFIQRISRRVARVPTSPTKNTYTRAKKPYVHTHTYARARTVKLDQCRANARFSATGIELAKHTAKNRNRIAIIFRPVN